MIKRLKPRALFRLTVFAIVMLLCVFMVVLPILFGYLMTILDTRPVDDPPDGFAEITLDTADGIRLAAWYHAPDNGIVIMVLHGAGGSRDSTRPYVERLAAAGFGVLALDIRGFGESGGETNQYGWSGTRDVGAAVKFIESQPDVIAIGGLGLSLGGEILMGAASTYPQIKAIISDGGTFRSMQEFNAVGGQPFYEVMVTQINYWSVEVFSGDEPPLPIEESLRGADSTAFLFIAAGLDDVEIAYNTHFAAIVGERGTLWVVPDVGHIGAFGNNPEGYTARIVEFFQMNLLPAVDRPVQRFG